MLWLYNFRFLDFLPHPTNSHPPTLKEPPQDKINKIMLPSSHSQVFHTDVKISKFIDNETTTELRPPASETSTKITKFDAHTASEQEFCKTGNENWPPAAIDLGFSRSVTGGHNHYTMSTYYYRNS